MERIHTERPRGYFKYKDNWESTDTSYDYFPGFMNKVGWPLIKSLVLIVVFGLSITQTSLIIASINCLVLTAFYQDVLALFTGRIRMPSMDLSTFLSSPPNNIMTSSEQDGPCV